MRFLSITGSEMYIYLTFEVLLPEMIFVSYSLNDFIHLFERSNKTHAWNSTSMSVRNFQSALATCLEETLPEKKFSQLKKYFLPSKSLEHHKIRWLHDTVRGHSQY